MCTTFTLFDTLVKPIIEYGVEIWGLYCSNHALEKFHLRFQKIILGVKSNSSNLMTYGDMRRLPLKLSFACKTVRYTEHLHTLDDNKLVKQVFLYLNKFQQSRPKAKTWVLKAGALLQDFDPNLPNSSIVNTSTVNNYTQWIHKQWMDDFRAQLSDTVKKSHFKNLYKHEISLEIYLDNDYNCRNILSKFRLISQCLNIEQGRHKNQRFH